MHLVLSLLLIAATATRTLAAIKSYDDLVLMCLPTKDIGNGMVEFGGKTKPVKEDEMTAVFLKNLKKVRSEGGRAVFQAVKVPIGDAKEEVKATHTDEGFVSRNIMTLKDGKPLLCVHGFNVLPEAHLEACLESKQKFKKFKLIPVIWPSRGGLRYYFADRKYYSKDAGKAFKTLAEHAGSFPKKALMAHSMGNRVLRYGADAKIKMDNIFMVAADVNGRMFDHEYITGRSNDEEDKRRKDGLTLMNMVKSAGKIYVVHNNQDYALIGSNISKLTKNTPRLGSITLNKKRIHKDIKSKIETKNGGKDWLPWWRSFSHSYQFHDDAVKFYEDKFYDATK